MSKHLNGMVDISDKEVVKRQAIATGRVRLAPETIRAIQAGEIKKGDPLLSSRIAAINATKQTPLMLPFCHQISLDTVKVDWLVDEAFIEVQVTVRVQAKTGVEMEALVGVSAALLNLWDMVKYLEKDEDGQYPATAISEIRVKSKIKEI